MILVTGANGFVGAAVVRRLVRDGADVLAWVRRAGLPVPAGVRGAPVGELSETADWSGILAGVDVLVHAAARVHVMNDTVRDPSAEFRRTNVQGTLHLATQSAAAGVRRFVFVSSIKVNGEATGAGHAFSEKDTPAPSDPYGVSKAEAEAGLWAIARKTGMELVIVRPPLVYGPGVKANFAALMRAVQRGWPLPLGAVNNQRSLVSLGNLVDFIATCVQHPRAANEVFLVSDGHDLSTPDLVRGLARAAAVPERLVPVPLVVLRTLAAVVGKGEALQRLSGNLQVDISKARRLLDWAPPESVDEALSRALGRTS
jgi:UDP-glucose 4-epimerase